MGERTFHRRGPATEKLLSPKTVSRPWHHARQTKSETICLRPDYMLVKYIAPIQIALRCLLLILAYTQLCIINRFCSGFPVSGSIAYKSTDFNLNL